MEDGAGLPNEYFLDPHVLEQFFISRLEPYGPKVRPLIFEFGTFNKKTFPAPADFMAKLNPFLWRKGQRDFSKSEP